MRRGWIWAALLSGALATGTWAVAQTWTGSGDTVQDLQYRLGILDAELTDIRARLQALGATAPARPAAGGGAASGAALVQLDRLEAELRRLTGQVEELAFRQRQIAEDATRRFGDIEFRLTELEGGDVGALGQTAPLGGTQAAPQRAPVEVDPVPSRRSAGTQSSPQNAGEAADLQLAVADIQQGRFDQGEARLLEFIDRYPGSDRTGEAQFWLGRSHFVRGAFSEAARRHLAGYNADRTGPMAARNLLQLGVTLGRLGQRSEACLTLREVSNQFPRDREMVNAADAERDSLACAP
ncbi:MAG: tetratricopeptide repeat protein [Pikeienuella sp.]